VRARACAAAFASLVPARAPHLHGELHDRDPSLLRRAPGSVLPCVSRLPCEEQHHCRGGARAEHLPPLPDEEAEADGGHGDPASDRWLLLAPAPTCAPCPPPHVRSGHSNGVGSSLSDRPRSLWGQDRAPWSSLLCWNWKVRDGEGAPLESTRQFLLPYKGPHSLDSLLLRRAPSCRSGASRRRAPCFSRISSLPPNSRQLVFHPSANTPCPPCMPALLLCDT
jgi:hypothetical protein